MKRGVYRLSIFQDQRYEQIVDECGRAISAVRPGGRPPGRRHHDGAVEVYSYWKHWTCLFPQHGPGLKHQRRISLAPWQWSVVERYPEHLIRGLIHSDGCRALNRVKGHVYPRYQFSNRSEDIRAIFSAALDRIGLAWRQSNAVTVSVSRRPDVSTLDRLVGPKR
jgi:hypothetical protein